MSSCRRAQAGSTGLPARGSCSGSWQATQSGFLKGELLLDHPKAVLTSTLSWPTIAWPLSLESLGFPESPWKLIRSIAAC